MLSSLSFPSFLAIPVIVIVTFFILWSNIATFSEGQKEIPSIKITSPTNGQNISTGTNLTISGIAPGTNTSSTSTGKSNNGNRCYVSVIINNIKPYHNATAGGPNGVDDYSKWYYTLSTKYSAIKEGQNKLTGKLSCLLEGNSKTNSINVSNITNNLIKWYSVNVTGVSTSTTSTVNRNYQAITNSTTHPQPQQQSKTEGNTTISSNSSAITNASHSNSKSNSSSPSTPKENNSNKIATSSGSVPTKLAQSLSTTRSASNYKYNNNNAKPLSISIQSSQNIVNGRGASTISATAYDVVTGKRIDNAIVKLKITFTSNGTSKEIVGHNGEVTYSAEIKPNSKDSSNISFRTTVQASAPGYVSTSKTTTSSSSSSSSTSTSDSNHQESINNNNLTQTILKNAQKKLKQNGIDIALG
jgi:hypothetical protein